MAKNKVPTVASLNAVLNKLNESLKKLEEMESVKLNIFGDDNNMQKYLSSLKKQNSFLDYTISKFKTIKNVATSCFKVAQAIGTALGGIGGALIPFGKFGINSFEGSIKGHNKANSLGITYGESKALSFAGNMKGIGENTLEKSIEALSVSLNDKSKYKDFAGLGLSVSSLKKKNSIDALFDTLDTINKSNLSDKDKKAYASNLGLPFEELRFILKEGTGGLKEFFNQGVSIYGKDNNESLQTGERALIEFKAIVEKLSMTIGTSLVPMISKAVEKFAPFIEKLSGIISQVLDSIFSNENLDAMTDWLVKTGNSILGALTGIFTGENIMSILSIAGHVVDLLGQILSPLIFLLEKTLPYILKFVDGLLAFLTADITYTNDDFSNQGVLGGGANSLIREYKNNVNDVVITKTGQVLRTSPEDYLFATKKPENLMDMSSGGGTINININNPSVRNDGDIKRIALETKRLLMGLQTGALA